MDVVIALTKLGNTIVLDRTSGEPLFDFNLKKGGAVIFDELSVHRGSAPSKTDRIVLRFIYKRINWIEKF